MSNISDIERWDPAFTARFVNTAGALAQHYLRCDVLGLESFPPTGGALVVCNHSGGMLTPDVLIFAASFIASWVTSARSTLGHDALFSGPLASWLGRLGLIHVNREVAAAALRSGGVVLDFPGGVYDAYRPTLVRNVVDFNGRMGYVKTAIKAGVPIVPAVSTGGQESQLFLARGTSLAKHLGLRRLRSDILPLTLGFPFGLSVIVPANMPLPTKIVTRVLEPIDIAERFGDEPEVAEVDADVRSQMQTALDRMAEARRFPVLG